MENPSKENKVATIVGVAGAAESDVEGILAVQRDTWIATYPNEEYGITKEDLEAKEWNDPVRVERWKKFVMENNPNKIIWVAKDEGKVVGFLRGFKNDTENDLQALYVMPKYQGYGIGSNLMNHFLDWIDKDKETTLGVAIYNDKTISFYKKFGFRGEELVAPGPIPDLPSGKNIPEIKMVLVAKSQ